MRQGKGIVGIIITIFVMIILFGGIVFAGIKLGVIKIDLSALKFAKEETEEAKPEETVDIYSKEYNADDYVEITKDEESGLKAVNFKKIDDSLISDFTSNQEKFKELDVASGNKKTNVIRTNADKAILSVYEKDTVKNVDGIVSENSYVININVETSELAKNVDIMDLYDKKIDSVTKTLVNKFAEATAEEKFEGDVTASSIKENSSKYTAIVKENIEKLVMYTRKDKLYVDMNPVKFAEILGLKLASSSKLAEITSVAL